MFVPKNTTTDPTPAERARRPALRVLAEMKTDTRVGSSVHVGPARSRTL